MPWEAVALRRRLRLRGRVLKIIEPVVLRRVALALVSGQRVGFARGRRGLVRLDPKR